MGRLSRSLLRSPPSGPADRLPKATVETFRRQRGREGLRFGFGLAEADDFVAVLELAALAEELDTLKALEYVAFRRDGAGAFETAVL